MTGPMIAATIAALALARTAATPASPRPPVPTTAEEVAALRALRLGNNRAIAAHDVAGTMAIAADDYVLVAGNDTIFRDKAAMTARWTRAFADPAALPCRRSPERFKVGDYDTIRRAAEQGRWECPLTTARGRIFPYGRYFAHWSKRSGAWKVVSDVYVTLGCRGEGCNPDH